MRTVSARFLETVGTSHALATEALILTTDADADDVPVPIVDGTVTLDQTAAVRGRCDVTFTDDGTLDLIPNTAADTLAPYGNEIQLSRGVAFPDGTSELVTLGVFRLQVTGVADQGDGSVQIRCSGLDRAQRIIDARFEEPYTVAAGTNYATAVLACVQAAWPDVPYDLTATAYTTPALFAQEQDDRWAFVQDMAVAIGMRLYFDGDGVLRLVPDVLSGAVVTLAEGDGGVLLGADREWTREGTFNRVVATGENTGETTVSRGVATDDNPLSPTYYYGDFGKVPRFYASPFVTTDAQAASAAQAILNRELGTTETVNFGSFVLPHLEPGDTATITRERIGVNEEHVIDSMTVPLSASGTMSGRTRARQVS